MKWTTQQQTAIDARGADLLVAAAAGSGKTAVLVQRICALVREGTPIDQMLIVTFTNAAAAEMRQRITEAFEQAGAQGDSFLAGQCLRIEHASISTLHRFCITVLRTHFQAAGVDPSFRIGDESETQVLRESAMQDAIDACFESGDTGFAALCDCFEEDRLSELAFSAYRFMMSRPDPWTWLRQSIEQCDTDEEKLKNSPWMQTLLDSARLRLNGLHSLLDAQHALVSDACGPVHYDAVLQSDAGMIDTLLQASLEGYEAFRCALEEIRYASLPRKSGTEQTELADQFKKNREAFKKALKTLAEDFSQPLDVSAQDIAAMKDALTGLEVLLRTFHTLYGALKRQRNLLDYNDLEHLTLHALESDAVADALREKYAFIFVDEYQDSNAIQESILTRIAREGSLFFVGDVKQSIYGFRQAEPSLFLSKYARFSDKSDAKERKIDLNQNFRSRKNVLACVNMIFENAMRAQVTDIEYDAQARLYPGLEEDGKDPDTQLLVLCAQEEDGQIDEKPEKEDEEDETGEEERVEDLTRIEQEALLCAQKIREIVGHQTLQDVKTKTARPIRYRDIAILLRSMRVSGPVIVQVLASQGIPAACDASEGYFDMPEIRQMLSLLQVIDNGQIDESLLSALRGTSVQLEEESLAHIRVCYPECSFSSACAQYAQEKEDGVAHTLRAFYENISLYRLLARYLSLGELIARVMNESGIYARAGSLPGGNARQANLRLLCQRAREYQRNQNGSLGGFLAYAQKLRAGGDSQSAKLLSENEDVVRVMTMHKSKGLEFPIVFLAALGQRFNFRAHSDPMLLHAQLGIGMMRYDLNLRSVRSTLSHTAIRLRLRHDALCEEVRVLYVAMTRARDQLYLIGSVKNTQALEKYRQPMTDSRLAASNTFFDLILPTVFDRINGELPALSSPLSVCGEQNASWTLTLLPSPRMKQRKQEQDESLSSLLAGLEESPVPVDTVSRRLAFKPQLHAHAQLKTSVTQLLREEAPDPLRDPIRRLPQFMELQSLSGASRGTLFHTAMREIRLERIKNAPDIYKDIQNQLDEMAERGIFTLQERKTLHSGQIASFFTSPTGARLLLSPQVKREWAFTWRMKTDDGETLVQGVIDCCFIENGAWVLLDYKTDGGEAAQIIQRYREQIELYARALEEITRIPVAEKFLYLVRRGLSYLI